MSFSGILTAALMLKPEGESLEDICFSVQETTFAMLTEVTERAMAHVEKSEVLLGGGVVQNKRLQEMVGLMARGRGAEMFCARSDPVHGQRRHDRVDRADYAPRWGAHERQ